MSHTPTRLSRFVVVGVTLTGLLVAGGAAPAFAAPDADDLSPSSAYALSADDQVLGAKSATGRLAQSDPELLARTDAAVTPVMVKVDVDPVASYAGGIDGYAATSPELTKVSIADGSAAIEKYTAFVEQKIAAAQAEASALIPGARMLGTHATVYGGFGMMIPANRAKDLLQLSSVAAVQSNELRQTAEQTTTPDAAPDATPDATPETTPAPEATVAPTPGPSQTQAAPEQTADPRAQALADVELPPTTPATDADATTFIGADAVWPGLGGRDHAGEGIIVGVIDTGIWPEHPMLADNGIKKPAGGPWACEFGDGTVGAAFACNDKLIGAYAFLDTYQAVASEPAGADAYCSPALCSARDAEGHGTHTATTAAGSFVDSAEIFGVDRGAISGVAPGASVIAYRALGPEGGYEEDLVASVDQAVLDGVDVLNYSISGSADPYDAQEIAFLDAYAAGIAVNASAGNDGPGASTANHGSPWTTTVAASTSDRSFTSALVLASSDGQTLVEPGVTITDGVSDVPVVLATAVPGYTGGALCEAPFAAGSLSGKVVLCIRGGNGRVEKGYNAAQGGAAGMILVNPEVADVETDNHFLPTIHLAGPDDPILAFLESHPGVTATWAEGQATKDKGDVMAAFSSRGPIGDFLKPDVTAPGVQVIAGNTPTPIDLASGPAGELYQAIAGTSMSSPHSAGVSALLMAAHPEWTPGQVKSALMTSSVQDVVNVDGSAAGVFDRGAGSIRADRAIAPVLTISDSAEDFAASASDALHRIDLNIPSVYLDPLPGAVSTKRTVTNVSGGTQSFSVKATGADGLRITVSPSKFTLAAGKSKSITVILDGLNAEDGWHEGQITITPTKGNKVVLPVAANVGEAQVSLSQTCDPTTIQRGKTTTCTVTAANYMPVPVQATIDAVPNPLLHLQSVTAPAKKKALSASWTGTLDPAIPPTVTGIEPTEGLGYVPLAGFGGTLNLPLADDAIVNVNVPSFSYGGESYQRVGVTSNGYLVVGGGTSEDVLSKPNGIPNPAAPNNVLAPLWTDLNPEAGGKVNVNVLSDGTTDWIVVEWADVPTFSGNGTNAFEIWIQLGEESVWYSYGADAVPDTATDGLTGAENRDGTSGVAFSGFASADDELAVQTAGPQAGGTVTFDYTLKGLLRGTWSTWVSLRSDALRAIPMEQTKITVK
ncbi:S8 family serine peptidase [Microbacterium sp. 4R-513]|uniref:S8 family serine peptidase n=1 Tax=Microbacterium sp. 4R-513 TaxID=2567934 RepID=UPI0013E1C952|nr:S8 family serine peptidase [Microbacterium sp. 4R-513]QIG39323.1 S8 family serine peptidase [Microbacterium sp. 4R-513]